MCCFTKVEGFVRDEEAKELIKNLLEVGGFRPLSGFNWIRDFDRKVIRILDPTTGEFREELRQRAITVDTLGMSIDFHLIPQIGGHTEEDHAIAAGLAVVLFNVAGVMAERLGGSINQYAMRGACAQEGQMRRLANYSKIGEPFGIKYENLCLGFRETLINGVPQEWYLDSDSEHIH